MDIQLLSFVNVFADTVEEDVAEENLCDLGFARYKDLGGFIAGVSGPRLGSSDSKELFPLWEGRYDLEWLGQFAGLVTRE